MCYSLCDPKNKFKYFDSYKLVGCYKNDMDDNHNQGIEFQEFKTVLVYEIANKESISNENPEILVLKSSHKSFFDFDTHIDYDFRDKSINEQLKFLVTLIRSTLQTNYGVKVDQAIDDWVENYLKNSDSVSFKINERNLIYYINLLGVKNQEYFENALKKRDKEKLSLFIKNLAVLLYQEEYLFFKYFHSQRETLKIYGTCGNFYAVEYAESLNSLIKNMNENERKMLAIKFLDLINALNKNYFSNIEITNNSDVVNLQMQVCDVKLDNFGISNDGQLKIIDTDMMHPNSFMFSKKFCEKHEDCHFFDCKSFCDKQSSHCLRYRINNNLQSVCEKIFNSDIKEDALLSNINYSKNKKLVDIVKICANPGFYNNTDVVNAADDKLINILKNILTELN
jgi:hypothetical protein